MDVTAITGSPLRLAPHRGHNRASAAWGSVGEPTDGSSIPYVTTDAAPLCAWDGMSETSGSSALTASVVASGSVATASRHRPATKWTSPYRSSWSRKMLCSSSTRGWMWRSAPGTVASSTSNRPMSPRGRACQSVAWATALNSPDSMFAPARLWIGRIPAPRKMCDSNRVVVVLPLVPETTMLPLGSEPVTSRRACGARRGTTWPAMTVPPPRPRRRLSPAAARPAIKAALSRGRMAWPPNCGRELTPVYDAPQQRSPINHPLAHLFWCALCVYCSDSDGR